MGGHRVCAGVPRATSEKGRVDISVPLRSGTVHWPDNPPVRTERVFGIERGDVANVSTLSLGSHTGTHMDAPLHFVRGGRGWTGCRSMLRWGGRG